MELCCRVRRLVHGCARNPRDDPLGALGADPFRGELSAGASIEGTNDDAAPGDQAILGRNPWRG